MPRHSLQPWTGGPYYQRTPEATLRTTMPQQMRQCLEGGEDLTPRAWDPNAAPSLQHAITDLLDFIGNFLRSEALLTDVPPWGAPGQPGALPGSMAFANPPEMSPSLKSSACMLPDGHKFKNSRNRQGNLKYAQLDNHGYLLLNLASEGENWLRIRAHTVVLWSMWGGAPFDDAIVLHVCRPARGARVKCLCPDHLTYGDHSDNQTTNELERALKRLKGQGRNSTFTIENGVVMIIGDDANPASWGILNTGF